MTYLFNCEKCKNRIAVADKHGFFHAFCTAIVDDKKQPIHFNSFKREFCCDEYEEELHESV